MWTVVPITPKNGAPEIQWCAGAAGSSPLMARRAPQRKLQQAWMGVPLRRRRPVQSTRAPRHRASFSNPASRSRSTRNVPRTSSRLQAMEQPLRTNRPEPHPAAA
jgi:hypothetical protein